MPAAPQLVSATASAKPRYPADPAWPPTLPDYARQLLDATNHFRAGLRLPALRFDPILQAVADWKARHLAQLEYFDHNDPAPPVARSVADRFDDQGWPANRAWAENLAYGSDLGAQQALDLLVSAGPGEGHYENIVNRSWSACGMAGARAPSGHVFVAQDFGTGPPQLVPRLGAVYVGRLGRQRVQVDAIALDGTVTYRSLRTHRVAHLALAAFNRRFVLATGA